jgi:hypothetical protein
MTVAVKYGTRRLAASIVAFGISAPLFGGALQSDRLEHEVNAMRTAAPTLAESKLFVNCTMAAFPISAKRAEPMRLCWRRLIHTALLVLGCFELLDDIRMADWRVAFLFFNCMRGLDPESG